MAKRSFLSRKGFNFYLLVSLVCHLFFLGVVTVADLEVFIGEPVEVKPVRVRVREPVQREGAFRAYPETMHFDAAVREVDRLAGLRSYTGVSEDLRRPSRPEEPERRGLLDAAYARHIEASPLAEFQPDPEVEGVTPESVVPEEIEDLVEVEDKSADDLMDLGPAEAEIREPSVVDRPSFPYARLGRLLPEEAVRVSYKLLVDAGGEVSDASVIESSGDEELDSAVKSWVMDWRYEEPGAEVEVEATVEIPAADN